MIFIFDYTFINLTKCTEIGVSVKRCWFDDQCMEANRKF